MCCRTWMSFLPTGYTKEEMKMENEGRKIMHHPAFRASVTCVRVPVYRAHSVAVSAEFEKPATVEAALAVLKKAPGLDVVDNPAKCEYPLPLYQSDQLQLRRRPPPQGLRDGQRPLLLGQPATNSSRAPRSLCCACTGSVVLLGTWGRCGWRMGGCMWRRRWIRRG